MKDVVEIELGGFVKNKDTGEYELMFTSFIGSPLLVKNRAIEKSSTINAFSGECRYDVADVKVMQRQTIHLASPWADYDESKHFVAPEKLNVSYQKEREGISTSVPTPVYAVVAVTSMSDYTEPHCYSSAPDHEEVVSLWRSEEKAKADADSRNENDKAVVEATDCDPTEYIVRKYLVNT